MKTTKELVQELAGLSFDKNLGFDVDWNRGVLLIWLGMNVLLSVHLRAEDKGQQLQAAIEKVKQL